MCELSIIILFCDKDWALVPGMISMIESNVPFSHEVILVDNREKFRNEPLETGNAIVKSKGYNTYQLEGRRWSVQFATGRYVWFVDVDDKIPQIKKDKLQPFLDNDCDIISCGYICEEENGFSFSPQPSESISYEPFTHEIYSNIGVCLWNKWIKNEVIKKVYSKVPEGQIVVASEDVLAVCLSLYYSRTFVHTNQVVYVYNKKGSLCFKGVETVEHIKHTMIGQRIANKILEDNIPSVELIKINKVRKEFSDACWFMSRVADCNKDIRLDAMKAVAKEFSFEEMKEGLNLWKSVCL